MEKPETKHFGRYEVVAELGRGAMGVVYQARDPQIDRLVALKTISMWGQPPEEEQEFRLRFMNEAQAAGRLHHPGIVSVFDVGESPENNDPYIVLEYVAGESLSRILAREKKLSPTKALKLAEEVADALDYAHAQGVIHRDIKPANIIITQDSHAKIADFGIAKLNLAHFTVPGRVLGTPAYMSPEQLSGQACDGRSDVFSLGVILYTMVVGHSPFQGDSATTVCFKVANREPVAASALDLSLPPQLDAVISRAMAKEPTERYQRAAHFADDLRILQQSYRPGSTTTSFRALADDAGTGSAFRSSGTANRSRADIAAAGNAFQRWFNSARIKDMILGALALVLLVIVAGQSKLLVSRVGSNGTDSASLNPISAAPPGAPNQPIAVESVRPAVETTQNRNRASAKTTHGSTRQIVIPSSTVDLAIQHQFKDGTLYVWVDDKLTLTLPLHGAAQKKLVVFNGVRGVVSETLKVPAGKRTLRFRALSTDKTTDLSKTLSAEFVGGDTKTLQVSFEKRNSIMRLTWQ
jgi:serine/threonine-protein kinase